jgi:hypothetical protein
LFHETIEDVIKEIEDLKERVTALENGGLNLGDI